MSKPFLAIISILGLTLLAVVGAGVWLTYLHITTPDWMTNLAQTDLGAIAALLAGHRLGENYAYRERVSDIKKETPKGLLSDDRDTDRAIPAMGASAPSLPEK